MRVLITNTSRMWGGTEQCALAVARGLAARGHAVRFLHAHEAVGRNVRRDLDDHGALRLRNDADLPGVLRLAREMRAHRADVVLLTKWREYLLGGLAAGMAGRTRPVVRLGLRVAPRDDLKRRLIFRNAARVIVNAEEIRAALTSRPWLDATKIRVVHNGVDLSRFAAVAGGGAFRRELGISSGAPLLLNVGALTPQKDQAGLLRAFAVVAAARPDARLVVVGEGFLRDELSALSSELALDDSVVFTGFRDDVTPALAAADLFVLSSDNEGMPWVVIEAMASGLPVVATDVSGIRACVEPSVNGAVAPPSDPDALAAAVLEALADPAALARMGEASRRLARERFDEERMITETEKVFLELCEG